MGKRPKHKRGAPVGAGAGVEAATDEDSLAEAEMFLERGDRQHRFKEPQKARKALMQASGIVRDAGLVNHPGGCLIIASVAGSLLQIDSEEEVVAGWAAQTTGAELLAKLQVAGNFHSPPCPRPSRLSGCRRDYRRLRRQAMLSSKVMPGQRAKTHLQTSSATYARAGPTLQEGPPLLLLPHFITGACVIHTAAPLRTCAGSAAHCTATCHVL